MFNDEIDIYAYDECIKRIHHFAKKKRELFRRVYRIYDT